MAIYHLSAQVIKRKEGRSAIAAAAYRAGERLVDRENGRVSDYTKRPGVVHTEIRAPRGAPDWMQDRETLWNVLEYKNRRKDAQLAREMNIALPRELPFDQQKELMRRFIDDQFTSRGMVADLAIHHDPENHNPHAHVMLSFYAANERGFLRTRTREWNSKDFLKEVRASWCVHANSALIAIGSENRIDHRSLESQGIDRKPTIHEGPQGRKAQDRRHTPTSNVVDLQTYAGKRRQVNYREIDEGRTRAQYNARILQFNDRHMSRKLVEALHTAEGYMQHRFLEATVRRAGVRLRNARREARSAAGSEAFWRTVLKQCQRAALFERMFGKRLPGDWRVKRKTELVRTARRRIATARRRAWWASMKVSTARRDYENAKLMLGKDRRERKERKNRSVARWMGAIDRIAPQTVRLDRLPGGFNDERTRRIASWLGLAAREQAQRETDVARGMTPSPSATSTLSPPPSQDDATDRQMHPIPQTKETASWPAPPEPARENPSENETHRDGVERPTTVEIALAAQSALQKHTDTMENLSRIDAKLMRLERLVRIGQADSGELDALKAERAATHEVVGGDNAWQRQADLKTAYSEALDHLEPEEVQNAEISEERRNELQSAVRQLDRRKIAESRKQGRDHAIRHRLDLTLDGDDEPQSA